MTQIRRPEPVWPVDPDHEADYARHVHVGRETARDLSVVVVGIARNAMPHMLNTLALVDELRAGFADFSMYVYENDSTDGTKEALDDFAAGHPWLHIRHDTLGGEDTRGFQPDRTVRLARCRNECHDYVRRHAANTAYTIVLDLDPHYGFSVDGVFSSIYWLASLSGAMNTRRSGAMASYSLWSEPTDGGRGAAHYDAWAARPTCWWKDRKDVVGFNWFLAFLPPVGARPMPMNSAFGGLCVYLTEAFLAVGRDPYEGGDCEHVALHKRLYAAGYQLYLNPGCRYVAHWIE